MRLYFWVATVTVMLLVAVAGCAGSGSDRGPVGTPVPTKTQRPTFTHTPAKPTAVPPTATPAVPPTATPVPATPTPEPPTAEPPTPTPKQATFTVTSATANVRSGPGTGFGRVGQVRQGQTFEITGKNPAGDWWQFNYNGRPAWISGQMVRASDAASVEVATNIPSPPPTPRPQPRPTAQPAAPQPPPVVTAFGPAGNEFRNAEEPNFTWVTFWGRLGPTSSAAPASDGYQLRVSAPSGTETKPCGRTWDVAYGGYGSARFLYNCKVELPRTAGDFRAVVVDGGGKEVSDAITGTLLDRTHDVIMTWYRR